MYPTPLERPINSLVVQIFQQMPSAYRDDPSS